jgi:microcystin-dependent protein
MLLKEGASGNPFLFPSSLTITKIFKRSCLFLVLLGCALGHNALGQAGVGIGVTTPHETAVLHIQPPTNNKGLLIPRLTTLERNTIAHPIAEGLLVYDTDANSLYQFNVSWQIIGVPPGAIMMWSGSIASIPAGWALCNGANNTPDLRSRFIVAAGSAYAVGATGGLDQVTLGPTQVPNHSHGITDPGHTHTNGLFTDLLKVQVAGDPGQTVGTVDFSSGEPVLTQSSPMVTRTTGLTINSTTGGGQPHENRPPYYALAFIMKL